MNQKQPIYFTFNSTKMILLLFTALVLIKGASSICKLKKKDQKQITSMIWQLVFDKTKGKHNPKLDGCMRDDYRVQWFEVFFENEVEKKRVTEIEKLKKLQKEKEAAAKKGPLLDLFAKTSPPEIPESEYYYGVLAINSKEVKPLVLPFLPKPKGPPQPEPFKPTQVKIKARLGNYKDEIKRTVPTNFRNPLFKNLMISNFKPDDLTEKLIKAFKFEKEPKCNPKILQNPMIKKKLKNLLDMSNCKKADVNNRKLRFENYNRKLDGDELVFGFKIRRLEFCKENHRYIAPSVAKKKPLFYRLFGCWYKEYPIKVVDKMVEEIDKHLDQKKGDEEKEKVDFIDKHYTWAEHHALAKQKLKDEEVYVYNQSLKNKRDKGVDSSFARFKKLQKRHNKAKAERHKKTLKKRNKMKVKVKKSLKNNTNSLEKTNSLGSKRSGSFSNNNSNLSSKNNSLKNNNQNSTSSYHGNSSVIDLNGKVPNWVSGLMAGINLNPSISRSPKNHFSRGEKKVISDVYKKNSSVSGSKRRYRGSYSIRRKKRRKQKGPFSWKWHNYHTKSGRHRRWVGRKERMLFFGAMKPKKNEPPKPFKWPKNPAFEFSIVYNSTMTKDIFFRKTKIKMSMKEFSKFMKKTGEPAPTIVPSKEKLEEVPDSEFPEYVEREGKVFKIVYEDVDKIKEEIKKEEENKKEKRLKYVKDKTQLFYLEKKRLYELRFTVRKIRTIERKLEEYKQYIIKMERGVKVTKEEDEQMNLKKDKIEKDIQNLKKLELERKELESKISKADKEKIDIKNDEMPQYLQIIVSELKNFDDLAIKSSNRTITLAEEKDLISILKKIEHQIKTVSDKEKKSAKKAKEEAKLLKGSKAKSIKKKLEKEKADKKIKPDYVEGLLITVGMKFLSLGPLNKKIAADSFVATIIKEFPEVAFPGLKGKVTGNTLALMVGDETKASFGFAYKEFKKKSLFEIEPFVYQRWLIVRETFEPYYIDTLKNFKVITKEEAELKHKDYTKRKNEHFENIYNGLKNSTSSPSSPSPSPAPSNMDTLKVPRKRKSYRLKRRVLEQAPQDTSVDENELNWLAV